MRFAAATIAKVTFVPFKQLEALMNSKNLKTIYKYLQKLI